MCSLAYRNRGGLIFATLKAHKIKILLIPQLRRARTFLFIIEKKTEKIVRDLPNVYLVDFRILCKGAFLSQQNCTFFFFFTHTIESRSLNLSRLFGCQKVLKGGGGSSSRKTCTSYFEVEGFSRFYIISTGGMGRKGVRKEAKFCSYRTCIYSTWANQMDGRGRARWQDRLVFITGQ